MDEGWICSLCGSQDTSALGTVDCKTDIFERERPEELIRVAADIIDPYVLAKALVAAGYRTSPDAVRGALMIVKDRALEVASIKGEDITYCARCDQYGVRLLSAGEWDRQCAEGCIEDREVDYAD